MTITSNTQLLFPSTPQSDFSAKISPLANSQESNATSFAQILDTAAKDPKLSPTISEPPSIRNTKTTELYDWLIEVGTLEPEWAERWAYLYGCEYRDSPLIYIGDWPIVRIAATGEIVTQEKLDYFKKVSDLYHGGRVNLYETELAKGTPPLEIIKKIFDYNDTLPEEYRKMEGWS